MKKTYFKKSMSVFLACLMILSCWVWFPGEHNHALAADGTVNPSALTAIYDGGNSDRGDSSKIVLCSDGGSDNTTVGHIRFNISSFEVPIENATLTLSTGMHNGTGVTNARVDVYPIQVSQCKAQSGLYKTSGIAEVYGSTYNAAAGVSNALNYYGLTTADRLGTFNQGTASTQTINVTSAVQKAKSLGQSEVCFLFIMPEIFNDNNGNTWSDTHIYTSGTSLSYTKGTYVLSNTGKTVTDINMDAANSVVNLNTDIATIHGSFESDADYLDSQYYDAIYHNVLYTDGPTTIAASATSAQTEYGNSWTGSNGVTVYWYHPTATLLYDGDTTNLPRLGVAVNTVMYYTGTWSRKTVNRLSYVASGGNGFDFNQNWRGSDGRLNFQYMWHGQGEMMGYTSTVVNDAMRQTLSGNSDNHFYANLLKFTGSMGDNEYWRSAQPTFGFYGDNGDSAKTITATTSDTLYIINYVPLRTAIEDAIAKIAEIKANPEKYTTASVKKLTDAAKALVAAKPNNYINSSSNDVAGWAAAAKSAVDTYNLVKNLDVRKLEAGYHNIFSFNSWYNSLSSCPDDVTGDLNYNLDSNYLSIRNNTSDERITNCSYGNHESKMYSVPVQGSENYVFEWETDNANATTQVFMFWYASDGTNLGNSNKQEAGSGKHQAVFTAPSNAVRAQVRFDNDSPNTTVQIKNVVICREDLAQSVDLDNWTSRPYKTTFNYGTTLGSQTLAVPARTGYTFNGWWVDSNLNGEKDSGEQVSDGSGTVVSGFTNFAVTQDLPIYSEWTPTTYTITYDLAGGTITSQPYTTTYTIEDDFILPSAEKTGHNFLGWKITDATERFSWEDLNGQVFGPANYGANLLYGNATMVAQWEQNSYTVTFEKADSTTTSAQYAYGTPAENITKPANTETVKTATNHTVYTWPAIADVTADATYKEIATTEDHDWSEWTVTSNSTCTVAGTKVRSCTVCGYQETGSADLAAHTPGAEATCTDPQTCTVCGTVIKAANGHTITEVAKQEATCGAPGWEAYEYCSVCDYTTKVEIPATGAHVYTYVQNEDGKTHTGICTCGATVSGTCSGGAADCENPAECSTCNTAYGDALGHSWNDGEETKAPTCINPGVKTYTCSVCSDTKTETIAATGNHIYDEYADYDEKNHKVSCSADDLCEEYIFEAHTISEDSKPEHVEGEWHDYKCDKCPARGSMLNGTYVDNLKEACFGEGTTFAQIEGNANAHNETCKCGNTKTDAHAYGDWAADPENTANNQGTMSRVCSECSYKQESTCEYEKTDSYKAPTCTENGYQGWHCKHSNCVNGYTEILPATGHKFSAVTQANAATCSATGNTAYKSCSACSKFFAADAEANSTEAKDSAEAFTTPIDGTAHKYGDWTQTKAPTCSADGEEERVCEYNTAHKETQKVAIVETAHEWDEGVVTTPATCSKEGVKTFTCKHNGEHTRTEAVEIDGTAHKYGDWTQTKAPTCSAEGEEERVCEYNPDHKETQKVAIVETAHEWNAATYTWTEADDTWACTAERVCKHNASHTETAEATEITSEEKTPATCEEMGTTTYTATFEEAWAGTDTKDVVDIAALGHNYSAEVTARPTQNEDGTWSNGTYTYTCKNDGSHTYTDDALRANYTEFDKAVADLEALLSNEKLTDEGKTAVNGALVKAEALAKDLVTVEQPKIDELVSELNRIKAAAEEIIANSGKPQPITEAVSGLKVQFLKETGIEAIESLQLNANGGFDPARLRLTNNNKDLPITVTKVTADKANIESVSNAVIAVNGSLDLDITAPESFNETGLITYTITYKIGSEDEGFLKDKDGNAVEFTTKAYIYVKGAAVTPNHAMDEKAAWPLTATSKWQHYFEAVNYGDFELVSYNSASKFSDNLEVGSSNFGFRHDAYDYAEDGCQAGCKNGSCTTGDAHAATYRYYVDTSLAPTWEAAGFRARITESAESVYENAPLKYVRLAVDQSYLNGITGSDKTFTTTFVPSPSSNVPGKTWIVTSTGTLEVKAYENPDRSEYLFGEHKNKDGFDETSAYVNFSGIIPSGVNDAKMMFSPRIEFNGKTSSESVTMTSHIWIVSYDKGALRAAVNAAEQAAYNPNYYDADKYSTYESALATAKTVLGKVETTQAEVNEATAALNSAVAALTRAEYVLTHKDIIHANADRNGASTTNTYYYLLVKDTEFTVPQDSDVIGLDTINKYDDVKTLTITETAESEYHYWYIDYSEVQDALDAANEILDNSDDYSEEFIEDVKEAKEALEEIKNNTETDTPELQDAVDDAVKNVTDLTGHEHTYSDATCTEPKTCSVCGATDGEAFGHSYSAFAHVDGTTTHAKTCSVCGDIVTENCTAGDWVTDKNATCIEKGSKYKNCEVCTFELEREEIPMIAHNFGGDAENKEVGKHHYACQNRLDTEGTKCGTYGAEEACSGGTADCLNAAVCSKCNTAYGEALGHNYNETVGTKNNDGTHTVACTRCAEGTEGHTKIVNCTYGEDVVTAPTCTKNGYTTHTCTACTYSYTDSETDATGHKFGNWTAIADGKHTRECTVCTDEEGRIETVDCTYGEWAKYDDATHRQYCEDCTNYEEGTHAFSGDIKKLDGENNHQYKCAQCEAYGVGTEIDAKEACFGEGTEFDQITGDAAEHKETCKCGREQNDDHNYSEWEVVNGEKTRKCSECNFLETVAVYTVTWVDGDGNVIETDENVVVGTVPTYDGETPTKTATAQYTYTFNNTWSPAIEEVTGDATYTAQFESTVNKYTVTWIIDGVETEEEYEYGATPTHADPTKEADAQYTYTFTGWTPAIEEVTGDAEYTAQFDATVNKYTVTWIIDGVETEEEYEYGATPTHADPTKEADAQYTYTFTGWTPAIEEVTGDAEYTAQFDATVNEYTIKFVDENGTEIQSSEVAYGSQVVYPTNPEKAYDADNHYTFAGWKTADGTVINPGTASLLVIGDAIYTATYTATAHSYEYVQNVDGLTHTGTCECKKTVEDTCGGGTADCDNAAVCSVCKKAYGDKLGHDYDTTKSEENLVRPVQNTDGTWTKGYYTYTCKNDPDHTTKEEVDRANYDDYNTAVKNLEELLETDITDAAKEAIEKALDDNKIADNLIASEKKTEIDPKTKNLVDVFDQYKGSLKTYTVTFVVDGKTVKTETVISGKDATAPIEGLTKDYDDTNHYTFNGWDTDFTNVKDNITVKAQFASEAHNMGDWTVTKKASCTEIGTKRQDCSGCDHFVTDSIAKRTHNLVDTTVALEPTCSATGIMNQKCDCEETAEYEACDYTTTRVMDKVADAHKAEENYTVMQKASCEAEGYKAILCEYCDAELSTETIAKREHNLVDTTVALEPTCSATGIMNQKCDCEETAEYEACDYTTTRVMDKVATNHTGTADVVKNKVNATCTEEGYTGDTYWSCCDTLETKGTIIPVVDHDMQKTAEKIEPTCEEAGKEAVYTCANGCGKTEGGEEIEALGHSWSKWAYVSGSCAEGKVVFGRECVRCDAEETEERTTSNVGHTVPMDAEGNALYDTYSAPNCTRDGMYTFTCAVCDTKEIRITAAEDPALKAYGHKWIISNETDSEGWIVTSEPTCFRTGAKYRVCANGCGTSGGLDPNNREVVIIPATDHAGTLISIPAKAATCTENGYTAHYYCTECGTDIGRNVIKATGHVDENSDGKCDSCKTQVGESRNCKCICHKDHWFMRFIYKIVCFFWKLFKIGKTCDCGFVHY